MTCSHLVRGGAPWEVAVHHAAAAGKRRRLQNATYWKATFRTYRLPPIRARQTGQQSVNGLRS